MAKKKAKASSKKPNVTGWVIAVIVIIVVVALLVSKKGEEAPTEVTAEPEVAEKGTLAAAEAPPMDKACRSVAIGIVPGSKSANNGMVTLTLKNSGRVPLEGTYFEFSDGVTKTYRKNADAVEEAGTIEYKVDLSDAAAELGASVTTFIIYPISDGKACANQAVYVMK